MCPDSSGLETIGDPLTTALTYDVVTDNLWLATTAGDIWSCDLDGCDCSRAVDGTSLLQSGTIGDIGMNIVVMLVFETFISLANHLYFRT